MKVLILGGAGFIGSAVVRQCLACGHSVRILTRPTRSIENLENIIESIEVFYGDMMDDHALGESLEGVDAVVHSVSTTFPRTVINSAVYDVTSNLIPLMRLVDQCRHRGITNLVYLSSGGTVYGEARYLPIDEKHPRNPIGLYGWSKLTAENFLIFVAQVKSLPFKILRLGNPYGSSQNLYGVQGVVGVALGCLMHHRPFVVYGDGQNMRDYVHVDDVADAICRALNLQEQAVVNIGTGQGTSILGIINHLREVAGKEIAVNYLPDRGIDVRRNVLSTELSRQVLGWQAKIDINNGLSQVVKQVMRG